MSPKDMAWDVSDYKLENLGPAPVPELNPEIDWDAVALMVQAEEAKKNTMSRASALLAHQLRELADKVEALDK